MKNLRKPYLCQAHNSGSILVVSLWILVFFMILGTGLYGIVSSQISVARAVQERTLGPYLAQSAFQLCRLECSSDSVNFNNLRGLTKKREKQLGDGKFIYSLQDEESKININMASKEVLVALPDLDENLAKKIIEIRNKFGRFEIKEEILLVEGLSLEIYNNLKDFITVYGDGKLNLNTASAQALKAIGFREDLIAGLLEFRAGPDGEVGTEDDLVMGTVEGDLALGYYISELSRTDLLNAVSNGQVTYTSKNFTIFIETEILNRSAVKYTIITDWSKINRWSEQ